MFLCAYASHDSYFDEFRRMHGQQAKSNKVQKHISFVSIKLEKL